MCLLHKVPSLKLRNLSLPVPTNFWWEGNINYALINETLPLLMQGVLTRPLGVDPPPENLTHRPQEITTKASSFFCRLHRLGMMMTPSLHFAAKHSFAKPLRKIAKKMQESARKLAGKTSSPYTCLSLF